MPRIAPLMHTVLLCAAASAADQPWEAVAAQHPRVIIVGIDGLGGESVGRTKCPNLRLLMRHGAWTLKARGVMPTVSAPNWASVLTGAGPEQHGITSNGWFKKAGTFQPLCSGRNGLFPTIFSWLRQQRPLARSAVFHDWSGIAKLVEADGPDVIEHRRGAGRTMRAAREYWSVNQPDLMFIHLLIADTAGHILGWNSPAYLRAVEYADSLVGELLAALQKQDALRDTFILVTSDHGGSGHNHGRNTVAEINIPWILAGPGVPAGFEITAPVSTTDTAPTVASLIGIHPPECTVGQRVASALPKNNNGEPLAATNPVFTQFSSSLDK